MKVVVSRHRGRRTTVQRRNVANENIYIQILKENLRQITEELGILDSFWFNQHNNSALL